MWSITYRRSFGAGIRAPLGYCVLVYSFAVCYHGSVGEYCCSVFVDGPTCLPVLAAAGIHEKTYTEAGNIQRTSGWESVIPGRFPTLASLKL